MTTLAISAPQPNIGTITCRGSTRSIVTAFSIRRVRVSRFFALSAFIGSRGSTWVRDFMICSYRVVSARCGSSLACSGSECFTIGGHAVRVLTLRRPAAAIATAAFFVVAPGTFAGLIPRLISGWEFHQPSPYWVVAQGVGVLLIVAGLIPPVHAFVQFAQAGGTPIPIAPTQRLVVTGFNRYVRNPMYLGLLTVIVGQALLFGQVSLLLYAAAGWIVTASFVHWYEEPTLSRRFGAEYEGYRRAVPAWWPRLHP
jgi:protein-S-isoprenylcysteine O-methyltransferase Ste14